MHKVAKSIRMSCEGGLICVRFEAGLLASSGGDAHVDANEDALVLQVSIGNVGETKLRHMDALFLMRHSEQSGRESSSERDAISRFGAHTKSIRLRKGGVVTQVAHSARQRSARGSPLEELQHCVRKCEDDVALPF